MQNRFRLRVMVEFGLASLVYSLLPLALLFHRSFTAYFIGLAWFLVISAIMFARIIFYSGAVDIRGKR